MKKCRFYADFPRSVSQFHNTGPIAFSVPCLFFIENFLKVKLLPPLPGAAAFVLRRLVMGIKAPVLDQTFLPRKGLKRKYRRNCGAIPRNWSGKPGPAAGGDAPKFKSKIAAPLPGSAHLKF
jgi:hypothetical protein